MGLLGDLRKEKEQGLLAKLRAEKQKQQPIEQTASPETINKIANVESLVAKANNILNESKYVVSQIKTAQEVGAPVEYHPKARPLLEEGTITSGKDPRRVTPAIPVEATATPKPGSKALVDYLVKRPSGPDASPVARVDKQKRAREVYDAFDGDKKQINETLRKYAKANKKSSQWVKLQMAEIVNLAEAQAEGTKVDTSLPSQVLEGGLQTAVSFGGKDLDITADREFVGKAGQVVGDIANVAVGIASTGGLGKTLLSQGKSKIVKAVGGMLANPDTNPVPDAIYAGLNEGDFSKNFIEGYALNIAFGRFIGGKGALKFVKELPVEDRALIRETMASHVKEFKAAKANKEKAAILEKLGITDKDFAFANTIVNDADVDVIKMASRRKLEDLKAKMPKKPGKPTATTREVTGEAQQELPLGKQEPDEMQKYIGELDAQKNSIESAIKSAQAELSNLKKTSKGRGPIVKQVEQDIEEMRGLRQAVYDEIRAVDETRKNISSIEIPAVADEPALAVKAVKSEAVPSYAPAPEKFPSKMDLDSAVDDYNLRTGGPAERTKGAEAPKEKVTKTTFDLKPVEPDTRSGFAKIKADTKDWLGSFGIRNQLRSLTKGQQSRIKGELFQLKNQVAKFEKAIKGQDRATINALLADPELRNTYRADGTLPVEVLDAVDDMRLNIDNLSSKLMKDGKILSEKLEATVDENMGVYLKRSYKKFYDNKWWDKVSKDTDTINGARNWINEAYGDDIIKRLEADHPGKEITEEMFNSAIDAEVKALATADWTSESMGNFTKWLGSVNRNNLKKQKDIPLPIRKLMGEFDDPVANSVFTAQNMIIQIEQSRTNRMIVEKFMAGGDNPIMFKQKRGEFDTPIKIDLGFGKSETLYTTKQFAKEFQEEKIASGKMSKMFMKANGALKGMQTVYNPNSHIRNFVGNIGFATANGHWRIDKMADAFDIVTRKTKNEELVKELISNGVLSSDIITSDLADITRKSFGLFNKDFDKLSMKQMDKLISNLPNNKAQKLYQYWDDVWKVYGYLNETAKGYSPKQAMENTKLIYPNYGNLPRWNDKMRNSGVGSFVGTFTAFPTSVVMTAGNTVKLAAKEMAGTSGLGKRSYSRAMGLATIGGYYAGKDKFVDMYNDMAGNGEPFNEWGMSTSETVELMQKYVSPWEEYAELIPYSIIETETGAKGIEYVNMSYTNPWSTMSEPLEALSRGEIGAAAYQALQPYVDPSMLASLASALYSGRDEMGKEVWSENDEAINNVANIISYTAQRISPWAMAPDILKIKADIKSGDFDISEFLPMKKRDGQWDTGDYVEGVGYQSRRLQKAADGIVDEYGKKYTIAQEAKNLFTGVRKQVFIPEQALKNNLWTTKESYQLSMRGATRKMRNESDENIIKMYSEEGEQRRRGAWNQMREVATDFRKFGMTDKEIVSAMREIGVSRKMIGSIMTGRYVPYRPSKQQIIAIRESRKKKGLSEYEFEF